jgi:hypothetical protein
MTTVEEQETIKLKARKMVDAAWARTEQRKKEREKTTPHKPLRERVDLSRESIRTIIENTAKKYTFFEDLF